MSPPPLPPPPSAGRPTGIPQRRRKSSIRTASDSVQEQYLDRVRQLAADLTLALPVMVGPEPPALARIRRSLEAGKIPFTARFDKGLLGALRAIPDIAKQEEAPRMLDARVDGNRRFFLVRGHVNKLCSLGVQNWDDPLCLMLAYGPLAVKHGLHLFAGSELWCTGTSPAPPRQWFDDLAERTEVPLAPDGPDGKGATCPHGDRPRVALALRGGPVLKVCGPCGHAAKNMHSHVTQRYVCDQPAKPVEVTVELAGAGTGGAGTAVPVPETLLDTYRKGRADEAEVVEGTLRSWRKGAQAAGRFVLGGRDFGADQDAFLAHLDLAPWEREPVRRMTAGGHVGAQGAAADVLSEHREGLPAAVDALLPGEGAAFVRAHPGVEARTMLRLAHDEAEGRAKTRDLPDIAASLGPLGRWIDAFSRDVRRLDRARLLADVRKLVPQSRYPAHLYAFLCAAGMEGEGERSFNAEQKQAGAHWASLAKPVLEATGAAYHEAVLAYLRETGAGESA